VFGSSPGVPTIVTGLGWTFAGFGMGLAFTSLSVLLMDLSPRDEQGINSAALQMSDSLGVALGVGAAGVVHSSLLDTADPGVVFTAVFALAWALSVVALLVSTRVAPRRSAAPSG